MNPSWMENSGSENDAQSGDDVSEASTGFYSDTEQAQQETKVPGSTWFVMGPEEIAAAQASSTDMTGASPLPCCNSPACACTLHAPRCIRVGPGGMHLCSASLPLQIQEEALQAVCGILGCSKPVARTLLMHFRWNSDALFGAQPGRSEHNAVLLESDGAA